MAERDLTIDKVAWHTSVVGNPETPPEVRKRFRDFVAFLQSHQLTVRQLLAPGDDPRDDFAVKRSDLTPEGYAVVKLAYDKWLKKIANRRKDTSDVRILEDALKTIQSEC